MRYQVIHTTSYRYSQTVNQCLNMAYVLPRNTLRQKCIESSFDVTPFPATTTQRRDYYGNRVCHFSIEMPHQSLQVTAKSIVDVTPDDADPGLEIGLTCGQVRQRLMQSAARDDLLAREFILPSPLVDLDDRLREYGQPSFADDRPLLSAVRELTQRIYRDFEYDPLFSDVTTPLQEVFEHRRGVCQDFAHLAIACVRANGFPARYISGYLETLPPPGQQKLVGSDASHAWFAVYSPGEGWFEFDPTNDKLAGHQHILTAWGRDYADVPPLRGVLYGGGKTPKLKVAVDVNRLD